MSIKHIIDYGQYEQHYNPIMNDYWNGLVPRRHYLDSSAIQNYDWLTNPKWYIQNQEVVDEAESKVSLDESISPFDESAKSNETPSLTPYEQLKELARTIVCLYITDANSDEFAQAIIDLVKVL